MQRFSQAAILAFGLIGAQACSQGQRNGKIATFSEAKTIDQGLGPDPGDASGQSLEAKLGQSSDLASEKLGCGAADGVKGQLLQEIGQTGLTQEKAVRLALLNNPGLLAYYENLEVGYAGLLEAGLRQNPVVKASTRFPDRAGLSINQEFDTAIDFLDFFMIPLRQRAAEADIRVIESEIRQKVLDLVKVVQINWLDVRILELKLELESKKGELKELAAALADSQKRAGNVSALTARSKEIQYEMAKEQLKNLKADLEMAKEKMNQSLGLFANEACFAVLGEIVWKSDLELPDITAMEKAAIENRPDMETIRREIDAIAQKAELKQWQTYSHLKVGNSSERDTDGTIVSGPSIELEIPIFNHGQGELAKSHALLEQAQKRLLSSAVQACSEVREFFDTANIYRSQLEDFENNILPDLAQQIVDGQAHYNVMTLGIYELFDIKEAEIMAKIEYTQVLKNYKKSEIELLHALGGSFDVLWGNK